MLYIVKAEELRQANLSRAPLPLVISRLYPTLVAPADLIPLLVRPVLVLLCPCKPEHLIRG